MSNKIIRVITYLLKLVSLTISSNLESVRVRKAEKNPRKGQQSRI